LREESREYWANLFWSLADGKMTEFNEIRKTEIFEFFRLLKVKEQRQVKDLKKIQEYGK